MRFLVQIAHVQFAAEGQKQHEHDGREPYRKERDPHLPFPALLILVGHDRIGRIRRGGEAQADGLQQAFVGGSGQRLFQIRSRAGRGLPVKAQRAAGEAKGGFELFQRKRHAAAGGEHNDALNVRHPHSVAEVVGGAFQLPGQPPERLGKAQKQAFLFFGRAAPVFAEQVQAFFIGNFIVRNFFGEGG